jgi:GT2 family glycosyltransferase
MPYTKISFIIPLYNHLPESKMMLASLLSTIPSSLSHEIILIDDASTDNTSSWLESLSGDNLKILRNQANLGYAVSNNKAVAAASGEILCLLNNDLIFENGWLEPMLKLLESKELKVGLVGNVQLRIQDQITDHAGVKLTVSGKFEHIHEVSESNVCSRVIAVTGACMLVKKQEFLELGAFDEQFVNGGEDVDLCYRFREAGLQIYVALKSRIQHHVSLSRNQVKMRDESNSRFLQNKWRNHIKMDLAKEWLDLFCDDNGHQRQYPGIDGFLTVDFENKPQLASLLIAENMLRRNEAYWKREVDNETTMSVGNMEVVLRGGKATIDRKAYIITSNVTFSVSGLFSIRNFYICGCHSGGGAVIGVSITVNGIQTKSFEIQQGNNFNLGIIEPLLLPNSVNVFSVRMEGSTALRDHLKLTHIVVDDQTINDFILQ